MLRTLGLLLVAALGTSTAARAEFLIGLTSTNGLVSFDSATPQTTSAVTAITGVSGTLVGIDYRPTNGLLYGATATTLYTINPSTGAATTVAALSPGLNASPFVRYGFDFNPVADLAGSNSLRVAGSNGQNARVNVATGVVTTDAAINATAGGNPVNVSLTAAAYSNNDVNPATGTLLYGLDAATNSLFVSTPPSGPNAGTYTRVGATGLSLVFSPSAFDIGGSGLAFAAFGTGFGTQLYGIDLSTGAATQLGSRLGSVSGGPVITLTGLAALPGSAPVVPVPPSLLAALPAIGLLRLARRRLV